MDKPTLTISKFRKNKRQFVLVKPIHFPLKFTKSGKLYSVKYPDLGVDAFAYSIWVLQKEIKAQIALCYNEYANEPDEKLTAAAIKLKRNLNLMVTVKPI